MAAAVENRFAFRGRGRSVGPGRALLVALVLTCAGVACGWAGNRGTDVLAGAYYAPDGVAIGGYDPVAYFAAQRPTRGDPSLAAQHEGVTFWFASRENRERFVSRPQRYAPQYGGYCAYGMSEGYRAPTEPDAFTIHEGRLYLNYNREVRELWNQDRHTRIERADKVWRQSPM